MADTRQATSNSGNRIALGVFLIIVSLFCFLSDVGALGGVGRMVYDFLVGFFGLASYAYGIMGIIAGLAVVFNVRPKMRPMKALLYFGMLAVGIFALHVYTSSGHIVGAKYGEYLLACYLNTNTAGGMLFGILAFPLMKVLTSVGALIAVCLVFLALTLVALVPSIKKNVTYSAASGDERGSEAPRPAKRAKRREWRFGFGKRNDYDDDRLDAASYAALTDFSAPQAQQLYVGDARIKSKIRRNRDVGADGYKPLTFDPLYPNKNGMVEDYAKNDYGFSTAPPRDALSRAILFGDGLTEYNMQAMQSSPAKFGGQSENDKRNELLMKLGSDPDSAVKSFRERYENDDVFSRGRNNSAIYQPTYDQLQNQATRKYDGNGEGLSQKGFDRGGDNGIVRPIQQSGKSVARPTRAKGDGALNPTAAKAIDAVNNDNSDVNTGMLGVFNHANNPTLQPKIISSNGELESDSYTKPTLKKPNQTEKWSIDMLAHSGGAGKVKKTNEGVDLFKKNTAEGYPPATEQPRANGGDISRNGMNSQNMQGATNKTQQNFVGGQNNAQNGAADGLDNNAAKRGTDARPDTIHRQDGQADIQNQNAALGGVKDFGVKPEPNKQPEPVKQPDVKPEPAKQPEIEKTAKPNENTDMGSRIEQTPAKDLTKAASGGDNKGVGDKQKLDISNGDKLREDKVNAAKGRGLNIGADKNAQPKKSGGLSQYTIEDAITAAEKKEKPPVVKRPYVAPPISLLLPPEVAEDQHEDYEANKANIVSTLDFFHIKSTVTDVIVGPTFSMYKLDITMPPGKSVSTILQYDHDISMRLAVSNVRIIAPIPNENAVGIEVPNKVRRTVRLSEIIDSPKFNSAPEPATFALGVDLYGHCRFLEVRELPHGLVAGTTGAGKSCCINSMIVSLLYKASPDDVRFILIDPKMTELPVFQGIPHLLMDEIICEADKAVRALDWAVKEMMRRNKYFKDTGYKDIDEHNRDCVNSGRDKLPRIIIVMDEFADIMTTSRKLVETAVQRLAALGRAAGITLILATQRPSADVISGTIKNNLPTRIAFKVSSVDDSRTLLSYGGCEKLLGKGDMLLKTATKADFDRIQGAFITNDEIKRVVDFVKKNNDSYFDEEIKKEIFTTPGEDKSEDAGASGKKSKGKLSEDVIQALKLGIELAATDKPAISISNMQRKLGFGWPKAAKIFDTMDSYGFLSPVDANSKMYMVNITKEELDEIINGGDDDGDDED